MHGNLALRKQFRANLRRMQRELQIVGREDVDALVAAVERSQRRILDQLEETSERLQSLEAKLDGLGQRLDRFLGLRTAPRAVPMARATAARRKNGTRKKPIIANVLGGRIMDIFNGGGKSGSRPSRPR